MSEPRRICFHKGASDAVLIGIGKLAIDAAGLDFFLEALEASLKSPHVETPTIGKIVMASKRCETIRGLAEQQADNQLVALMDQVKELIDKRNWFIHGVMSVSDDDATEARLVKAGAQNREISRTSEEIEQLVADIGSALGQILDYLKRHSSQFLEEPDAPRAEGDLG